MYNPDFWEVRLDPQDVDKFANEAGIWFETAEENQARLSREIRLKRLINPVLSIIDKALTEKQRQVLLLYFLHRKTQEEVAQIMGISRRVVSQHLFGICRNGRRVGGALAKIRKVCRQQGLGPGH
jgi:RNA polymerase sigma factor (sigma-70 family)